MLGPDQELDLMDQVDYRGKPRRLYQTVNNEPSQTVQSDADAADIKKILKRFKQTGIVEGLRNTEAQYLDVTELGDFADVMRVAKEAEVQFMQLPPEVRAIFKNDVANWLDTAHDKDKQDALVEAGFIDPPKVEAPTAPVEPIPAAEPTGGEEV